MHQNLLTENFSSKDVCFFENNSVIKFEMVEFKAIFLVLNMEISSREYNLSKRLKWENHSFENLP